MKAIFGVVSLLVVLAVVGVLASRQMKALPGVAQSPAGASAAAANAGSVAEQSRQLQDQVRNDVAKALEQGAAARQDADK
ncbi:MAG TPA: hypothetical protein VE029_06235 [Rhizobacter sp.]|nr:hypothetical protein [Rhizobacter sp.]